MIKLSDIGLSIADFKIGISYGAILYNTNTFQPTDRIAIITIDDVVVPFHVVVPFIIQSDIKDLYDNKQIEKAIVWYINTDTKFIRKIKINNINGKCRS